MKAPFPNAPRAYSSADVGSGRESEDLEVGASPRSAVDIQRQNAVQDILDLDIFEELDTTDVYTVAVQSLMQGWKIWDRVVAWLAVIFTLFVQVTLLGLLIYVAEGGTEPGLRVAHLTSDADLMRAQFQVVQLQMCQLAGAVVPIAHVNMTAMGLDNCTELFQAPLTTRHWTVSEIHAALANDTPRLPYMPDSLLTSLLPPKASGSDQLMLFFVLLLAVTVLALFVMNEAQHAAHLAHMLALCAGIVPYAFWPKRYAGVRVMIKSEAASWVCFLCILAPILQTAVAIVVLIAASILLTKKQAVGDAILSAVALTWVLDVDNKVGEICAWPGKHFAAANTKTVESASPGVKALWGFRLLQLFFATSILYLALLAQWSVAHIYHAYDEQQRAYVASWYNAYQNSLSGQDTHQNSLHTRLYLLGIISPACFLIVLFHRHPMFSIMCDVFSASPAMFLTVAWPLTWSGFMIGNVFAAWQFDMYGKLGYPFALIVAFWQAVTLLVCSWMSINKIGVAP